MIKGLQYLTHTRLDIENVVKIIAIFQDDPSEENYVEIKRMFRYLKGIVEFKLWYDRQ